MEIRAAKLGDISKIVSLGDAVEEFKTSNKVVTFWPRKVLINVVKSRDDIFLVAVEKGEVMGFIIASYSSVFKKATLENIYVSDSFKGRGVSEKLLNKALEKLKLLGCDYVCGLVEDNNKPAIRFFLRNGFDKGRRFIWMDKILGKLFKNKR